MFAMSKFLIRKMLNFSSLPMTSGVPLKKRLSSELSENIELGQHMAFVYTATLASLFVQ